MATGKKKGQNSSQLLLVASGAAVEHPCNFCLSRDKILRESVVFCPTCDSNLCRDCTLWHADFHSMWYHPITGISRPNSAPEPEASLLRQRCRVHDYKVTEMFCRDHDALACDLCVSTYHRKCENLEYIPMFSKKAMKDRDLTAIQGSTTSVWKALSKMSSSKKKTLQKLDTAEQQCQQSLQDHRDKLVMRIDELTKTDSAKITEKFREESDAVKETIKFVDDQIEILSKRLNESSVDNETEITTDLGEMTDYNDNQILPTCTLQHSNEHIPKYVYNTFLERSIFESKCLGEFVEPERFKLNSSITPEERKHCDDSM